MSDDHRAVLGLGRGASADEIRAAYRRAAKRAHPDLGGSSEAFQRVRAAADALLADLRPGGPSDYNRPYRDGDRTSLAGDWMTVSGELMSIWSLSSWPTTVYAPQKIGLSPFADGASLNGAAYNWLLRTLGPRGMVWDFHIAGSLTRIFFRSADDARQFKLTFH